MAPLQMPAAAFARGGFPIPMAGWEPIGCDRFEIRCLSSNSNALASARLGDVFESDLGRLPSSIERRIAEWMAAVSKDAPAHLRGPIVHALQRMPVQLVHERMVFDLRQRSGSPGASLPLRYEGTGVRVDVPDLAFVEEALPPAISRQVKEQLRAAFARGAADDRPFQRFGVSRALVLSDFAGEASVSREGGGEIAVRFSAPAFRRNGESVRIAGARDVAVSVEDDGANALLGLTAGTLCPQSVPGWGWSDAVPERHRVAYGHAQHAELVLEDEELNALTLELLAVRDEAELEQFLGKLVHSVARAASGVAKSVERSANAVARTVGRSPIGGVLKAVAPVVGTVAKLASHSPFGALARATYGAVSAVARGENVFMGALDGLAGNPMLAGLVHMGGAVLRGENVLKAAKQAMKAGIDDAREAARFAAMVAPFVPGIGTGIGAALGAANALASGQPIGEAIIAAARGALPGGAIAQAAFDTAAGLVRGQRLDQAMLGAARSQLPPGPAQAAFDTGLALVQGKKLQEAMVAGAGRLLPASPYAADALSFARRALNGENLGRAALSTAGNAVLNRARQQGNDVVRTVRGRR